MLIMVNNSVIKIFINIMIIIIKLCWNMFGSKGNFVLSTVINTVLNYK